MGDVGQLLIDFILSMSASAIGRKKAIQNCQNDTP